MMPPFLSLHKPVMGAEVVKMLNPQSGEVHVDGTFGCGGYSYAILQCNGVQVVAIDRDPDAIERGDWFTHHYPNRFQIIQGTFGELATLLAAQGIAKVDGVVVDLGVSSPQFDQAERGFSFRDGPLDMRMDQSGESAAEWLEHVSEKELADVIYNYGEERQSRAIARAIVRRRIETPLTRTSELAELVRQVVGPQKGIDAATKTFMAIRIHINDELAELKRLLTAAQEVLRPGGRLVVVSFHSLEDRIVKEFFSSPLKGLSRYVPEKQGAMAAWEALTSKPLTPCEEEVRDNPRARSAKLRAARRLDVSEGSVRGNVKNQGVMR